MIAMLRIDPVSFTCSSRGQKRRRPPGGWPPPELPLDSTLLRRDRRSESLKHRSDRVGERAARAAGEAEPDRVVAQLGHHQRAGITGADEAARRHDLTVEGGDAARVANLNRDIDRLDRSGRE